MATIIYDPKQDRSVNLDLVESIELEEGRTFAIVFEKLQTVKDRNYHAAIDRWKYDTEIERDSAYDYILKEFGKRIGYENNPLAT